MQTCNGAEAGLARKLENTAIAPQPCCSAGLDTRMMPSFLQISPARRRAFLCMYGEGCHVLAPKILLICTAAHLKEAAALYEGFVLLLRPIRSRRVVTSGFRRVGLC